MSSVNYAAAIVLAAVLMQGCFESKGSSDKAAASSVSAAIFSVGRSSSESSSASVSSQASASSSQNSSSAAGPVLRSLSLSIPVAELQESHAAAATVTAAYADGTTKTLSSGITWQIGDPNVLETKGVRLIAKGEGTASVRAKADGKLSPARSVTVYKVVHGHRLPPEPDPVVNNATLLGIDSNNNGVRDDVERAIYFRYKRPIEQAYMMQSAKWYPQTLEDPVAAAESKELEKENWNRASCDNFLLINGIETQNTVAFIEKAYFNTKDRTRAYIKFNEASSGGVFHIPLLRDADEANCDFNVTKMLEMEK